MSKPNKKEIKVLRYLNKVDSRYANNKRGDLEENIKSKLEITDADIGDMHYSRFLQFDQVSITAGLKNTISITHEGSAFVENYSYEKVKEWVVIVASVIAAIFAVLTYFSK